MQEPTFDSTNQATFRLARQPAKEHQEEVNSSTPSTLQRDPLAQLSCRIGDASCIGAHADTLNRAAVQPVPDALLRLQRHYGNRFVQRVVTLARSGDGSAAVAPEVEQTIQQARGGGQALDHGVRAQMEPAFNADFSGVRVHTSGQADNLNRALSARAFATGQDIFFKQGEYNPGSSTGRELLAHELTHVVQQNGDAVQTKLTVGAPGDRYEQEADSVARAVMQQEQQPVQRQGEEEEKDKETPMQAKFENGQVQRQGEEEKQEEKMIQAKLDATNLQEQLNLSTNRQKITSASEDRIQCLTVRTPGAGMGVRIEAEDDSYVRITPHATYWVNGAIANQSSFGDKQLTTITANPGTQGMLQMWIPAHIFIDNTFPWTNIEYEESALINWPIRVTSNGDLVISDALPPELNQGGAQTVQLFLGSVETAKSNTEKYVTATVNLINNTSHTRTAGVGYTMEQGVGGRTFPCQFRINLNVPQPGRQATVTMGPIRLQRNHVILFERPSQSAVSSLQESRLIQWYESLSVTTKERIQSGAEPIELVGRASTTGNSQTNRELSNQRMETVQRILRQYGGSQAVFHTRAVGFYQAQTGPNVESQAERSVSVSVWEQGTEEAVTVPGNQHGNQ